MCKLTVSQIKSHPGYIVLEKICHNGDVDFNELHNSGGFKNLVDICSQTCGFDVLRAFIKNSPEKWFDKTLRTNGRMIKDDYHVNRRSSLLTLIISAAVDYYAKDDKGTDPVEDTKDIIT